MAERNSVIITGLFWLIVICAFLVLNSIFVTLFHAHYTFQTIGSFCSSVEAKLFESRVGNVPYIAFGIAALVTAPLMLRFRKHRFAVMVAAICLFCLVYFYAFWRVHALVDPSMLLAEERRPGSGGCYDNGSVDRLFSELFSTDFLVILTVVFVFAIPLNLLLFRVIDWARMDRKTN